MWGLSWSLPVSRYMNDGHEPTNLTPLYNLVLEWAVMFSGYTSATTEQGV